MNMEALSYVKFGDKDGLGEFLFENGVQHQLFYEILGDNVVLCVSEDALKLAL